jgi:hypothetical protein
MQLLFVIFVVSICALVWSAILVARHIRRHDPKGDGDPNGETSSNALDP